MAQNSPTRQEEAMSVGKNCTKPTATPSTSDSSPLPIHLAKHKIHSPDNRHRIRQQVTAGDLIKAAEMRKARRPDLASVRSLAPIADQEDTHLSLGRFNGGVSLAGRDAIALCEEKEVVDEGFHVFLHGGAGRWRDLVVFDADGTGWHLVETLMDDAEGLAELFHPAEVAVVAVPVYTYRDIEFDLIIGVVWLALADVPGYAGASQHHAGEGVVECVGRGYDTNALRASFPDSVVGQEFLGLVDAITELGCPLVYVVEKADGEILVYASRTDVSSVETGTGDTLIEFLGEDKNES